MIYSKHTLQSSFKGHWTSFLVFRKSRSGFLDRRPSGFMKSWWKLNHFWNNRKIRYAFVFCSWFLFDWLTVIFTRSICCILCVCVCVNPGFMWWVTAPGQVPCVPLTAPHSSHNNWRSLHASTKCNESSSQNQCSALNRPCISTWYLAASWRFVSEIVCGASKLIKLLCKGSFFKYFYWIWAVCNFKAPHIYERLSRLWCLSHFTEAIWTLVPFAPWKTVALSCVPLQMIVGIRCSAVKRQGLKGLYSNALSCFLTHMHNYLAHWYTLMYLEDKWRMMQTDPWPFWRSHSSFEFLQVAVSAKALWCCCHFAPWCRLGVGWTPLHYGTRDVEQVARFSPTAWLHSLSDISQGDGVRVISRDTSSKWWPNQDNYCSCEYFWCSIPCTSCHYRRWMLPWSMVLNYDCHMPSIFFQWRFSFSCSEEVWVCHSSGTRQHETRTF